MKGFPEEKSSKKVTLGRIFSYLDTSEIHISDYVRMLDVMQHSTICFYKDLIVFQYGPSNDMY